MDGARTSTGSRCTPTPAGGVGRRLLARARDRLRALGATRLDATVLRATRWARVSGDGGIRAARGVAPLGPAGGGRPSLRRERFSSTTVDALVVMLLPGDAPASTALRLSVSRNRGGLAAGECFCLTGPVRLVRA